MSERFRDYHDYIFEVMVGVDDTNEYVTMKLNDHRLAMKPDVCEALIRGLTEKLAALRAGRN